MRKFMSMFMLLLAFSAGSRAQSDPSQTIAPDDGRNARLRAQHEQERARVVERKAAQRSAAKEEGFRPADDKEQVRAAPSRDGAK